MRLIFTANGGSLAMPGEAEMARKLVKEAYRTKWRLFLRTLPL